jgi:hypothetical protein
MRGIKDRLYNLFEASPEFVQHQGQDDRNGKTHGQGIKGYDEGVLDQPPEIVAVIKIDKMPESHPGAPGNAQNSFVVLKGNLQAIHGPIIEQGNIDQGGKQKEIVRPVFPNLPSKGNLFHKKLLPLHFGNASSIFCFRRVPQKCEPRRPERATPRREMPVDFPVFFINTVKRMAEGYGRIGENQHSSRDL